jgi:hypothetical protein
MSSLGDTISFSIAGFIIFVSFALALFQNIGVLDPNNHFMSTATEFGQNDTQVKELLDSNSKVSSQAPNMDLITLGYMFLTTVLGGLYNAVIGLYGWLTYFYVPPVMAAGIQIAIDSLFVYDLYILWRSN